MKSIHANHPMPASLKALIIAAGIALLIAGGAALAYQIWWQTKGAEVVATLGDGTRFGSSRDRAACVREAVLRVKRASGLIGLTDQVKNELFLEECLKIAAPVAGFCTGVPSKSDTEPSAVWQAQASRQYGLEGTLRQGLVKEIQDFCDADAESH